MTSYGTNQVQLTTVAVQLILITASPTQVEVPSHNLVKLFTYIDVSNTLVLAD
jgi:hypothetical protein